MVTLNCSLERTPILEISLMDQTIEQYSWAKVADSYLSNEDGKNGLNLVWLMNFTTKLKQDLGKESLRSKFDDESLEQAFVGMILI
jgi:hypothetical protein